MGVWRWAIFPLGLLACAEAALGEDPTVTGALTPPSEWDRAVTRPPTEALAATERQRCKFTRGAMPAETLGAELPVDKDIPIETIVVLMQENRSFDSYLGHLGRYTNRTDILSAPEGASNPERVGDPNSPTHAWTHAPRLCFPDTNHEWWGAHLEHGGGANNGFFQANDGFNEGVFVDRQYLAGDRALWWYDERDIPFYYDLASTFAIGDHYYSSLLGPTYPNRDFLYAATSRGGTSNHSVDLTNLDFPAHDVLIFDELERRGITWSVFVSDIPHIPRVAAFLGLSYMRRWPSSHFETITSFFDKAKAGKLPQVVFVDANINEDHRGQDEHPPADVQVGQKFVSDVTHALFQSPQWGSLAMFISYDENGGIYDHAPPPAACPPDGLAPVLAGEDAKWPGAFDRLGFRVPFIVVSPFTKRGYVSHNTYDHTSITRFIETKWRLPALTSRDANAESLLDFFDFEARPFATPPTLAAPTVDPAQLAECDRIFGPAQPSQ
jgi:phospholipase C